MLSIIGGILLGLLVGSFLNVVIYRLPIMLGVTGDDNAANY